jgi:tetratricopeptide (TPR) repeat protein
LTSLTGDLVTFAPPAKGQLLLLYFFDSEREEILSGLSEAASASSATFSLMGIGRGNVETLKEHLPHTLHPLVLSDDKGVTYTYGLSNRLPACVIIGPGGTIASILAPLENSGNALFRAGDAFMSMGLPDSALRIYDLLPETWEHERAIARYYALLLGADAESAVAGFTNLAGAKTELSTEAHAGLAFFHYREGKDGEALAECGQAPSHGFANLVCGLVKARQGDCASASASFGKAAIAGFSLTWQKALALNMAARAAEASDDQNAALRLYKSAFEAAPLNPYVNANLLFLNWRLNSYPAASLYAESIRASGAADPLVDALVEQYESQTIFAGDPRAQSGLERRLAKPPQKPQSQTGKPLTILVSDFTVTDCPTELAGLPVACPALLRKSLEGHAGLVSINRPEWQDAARRLNIPSERLADPTRVKELASALSADLLAFGALGTYAGKYVLNIWTADVDSGAVIAVSSERFQSLEQLPQVMASAAGKLMAQIEGRYGSLTLPSP